MSRRRPILRAVMSRRRLHLMITLLLPLMALRALLPAGYMPVSEDGQLRIVMCSQGMAQPDPAGADHGKASHQLPPGTGDCPFAHAPASVPPLHFIAGIAAPVFTVQFIGVEANWRPPATGPPRRSPTRAPPVLS